MKENTKIQGQLGVYLQWPIILSVFLVAANLAVGAVSARAGLVMSGFTILYVIIALWLLFYRKKRILAGLVEFSAEYAWVQKQLLYDMVMPYAITDESGHLLWMNKAFSAIVNEDKSCRKSLSMLFPEITRDFLEVMEEAASVHSSFDGRFYQIDVRRICMDEEEGMRLGMDTADSGEALLAVYLFDETQILTYEQEIDNQRLVAGLIYLDNYDEAMDSVEEVRRSL
ncbi:MAG: DHH family phosphoesterase, partial [Clostridium sp.]|nr:DHH family phosphoesterase [Clostridium sp.]